jgi:hypothetical protein
VRQLEAVISCDCCPPRFNPSSSLGVSHRLERSTTLSSANSHPIPPSSPLPPHHHPSLPMSRVYLVSKYVPPSLLPLIVY